MGSGLKKGTAKETCDSSHRDTKGPIQPLAEKAANRTHGNTNYRHSRRVMAVLSSACIKNEVDSNFYVFIVSVDDTEPQGKGSGRIQTGEGHGF